METIPVFRGMLQIVVGIEEAPLHGFHYEVDHVARLQLRQEILAVALNRVFGETKARSNLTRAKPFRYGLQHLLFTGSGQILLHQRSAGILQMAVHLLKTRAEILPPLADGQDCFFDSLHARQFQDNGIGVLAEQGVENPAFFVHGAGNETGFRVDADLSLYPNPASEMIRILSARARIERVSIVNLSGRLVYESPDCLDRSEFRYDVSGLASGLYFARVKTNQGVAVLKFVIR